MHSRLQATSRRRFLRSLAASPALGLLAACNSADETAAALAALEPETAHLAGSLISTPDEALSVYDYREVARDVLPPAHYGYLATGTDDNDTLRANRRALERIQIRARRLVDVSEVDTSVELLGRRWDTPIVIAPAGSQRAFHDEGELAVARAARRRDQLQILSTVTTTAVEEVNEARGEPVWYQLYPSTRWAVAEGLIRRVEAAGCEVLVLTVDLPRGGNREALRRYMKLDNRVCGTCHEEGVDAWLKRKPMYEGLDTAGLDDPTAPDLTWEFLRRLRDTTGMQLVLKGIVTREDAALAVEAGVDAVIVSNHGGRAEGAGRGSIDSLADVLSGVQGAVPVMVDSGFRRGTDIVKALALGAAAVGIGRPYLWGLAGFGEDGVGAVLDLMRADLEMAMRMTGVSSVADLNPGFVTR